METTFSEDDVKRAFKRLSLSYHPDRLHNRSVDDEARRAERRRCEESDDPYGQMIEQIRVGETSGMQRAQSSQF